MLQNETLTSHKLIEPFGVGWQSEEQLSIMISRGNSMLARFTAMSLTRHLSLPERAEGRHSVSNDHRKHHTKTISLYAIAILRVLAVAAVIAPPLAEAKSWSRCLVFALFSCLMAAAVNVVVDVMMRAEVVDVVLFCFPQQPLAIVLPIR